MLRQVKTENGWVRGIPAADPRITAFKGIPFAAPPVGDLRWKAPQPAKNWDGVLECYQFGPMAMQAPINGNLMPSDSSTSLSSERVSGCAVGFVSAGVSVGSSWVSLLQPANSANTMISASRSVNNLFIKITPSTFFHLCFHALS